ncbi:hypothetical protein [Bacillus paranthracis]|uniref:Uncharacterized protein n=1 Tax=Bacillus paranthracis TaxID=2026186 RepID=A0AAJ1NEW7_9BACI|nr:hypothetical protein [Bacillus paranthracis]MDG0949824.1 hypothetical protein [Bacillus paranthracis]MDG0955635.1 hypothetical protein [Bacillus paranthracis]
MIDIWERLEIDEHEENSNLTIINLISLFISMKNEGVPANLFEDVVIQKLDWNADFYSYNGFNPYTELVEGILKCTGYIEEFTVREYQECEANELFEGDFDEPIILVFIPLPLGYEMNDIKNVFADRVIQFKDDVDNEFNNEFAFVMCSQYQYFDVFTWIELFEVVYFIKKVQQEKENFNFSLYKEEIVGRTYFDNLFKN